MSKQELVRLMIAQSLELAIQNNRSISPLSPGPVSSYTCMRTKQNHPSFPTPVSFLVSMPRIYRLPVNSQPNPLPNPCPTVSFPVVKNKQRSSPKINIIIYMYKMNLPELRMQSIQPIPSHSQYCSHPVDRFQLTT